MRCFTLQVVGSNTEYGVQWSSLLFMRTRKLQVSVEKVHSVQLGPETLCFDVIFPKWFEPRGNLSVSLHTILTTSK